MGSVLGCFEASDHVEIQNRTRLRETTVPLALADYGRHALQERANPSIARQYEQHLCTCDSGACPRMRVIRPVVDAYLNGSTPHPHHVDALYRVTASLATFDERQDHDTISVHRVHNALVYADGDESIAFAIMTALAPDHSWPSIVARVT